MNGLRTLSVALLATSLQGCQEQGPGREGGPGEGVSATLVREVSVAEPDPPFGAYTSFIAVASSGEFFITDVDRGRVVAFAPSGTVTGTFGAAGAGPGEFLMAATLEVLDDSLLAVADLNARTLKLFNISDRTYTRTVGLSGFRNLAGDWSFSGDTAYFAALDAGGVLAVWPLGEDSASLRGVLPAEYLTGRPRGLLWRYGRIGLSRAATGLVVHLPTEDGVRRVTEAGRIGPLVPIPARFRRGITPELHQLKASTSRERTARFPLASLNTGLAQRGDGLLVAYHWEYDHDPKSATTGTGGGPGMTNLRLFGTLISPALDSACIDVRLPIVTDTPPFPVTVGDTTFVFTRSVDMAKGTVASTLRAFYIDPKLCRWEAIGEEVASRQ